LEIRSQRMKLLGVDDHLQGSKAFGELRVRKGLLVDDKRVSCPQRRVVHSEPFAPWSEQVEPDRDRPVLSAWGVEDDDSRRDGRVRISMEERHVHAAWERPSLGVAQDPHEAVMFDTRNRGSREESITEPGFE